MLCPNCPKVFRLRADYAAHLQTCRPKPAAAPERVLVGARSLA